MNVFIATSSFGQFNPEPLESLKAGGLEVKMNPLGRPLTEGEVAQWAGDCVGIIAGTEPYTRDNLKSLSRLRVISRCGVGLDGIDLDVAAELGISVAFTPQAPIQAVAELTLGLILNLVRHIETSSIQIKRGVWKKQMGFLLEELIIGIIGLGRIGKRVATLLKGLEAKVFACDIQPDRSWAQKNGVTILAREDLIKISDVLSLHLPYSKDVHHLIGKGELEMMKPGSYLVNASRGGLVDEDALCMVLRSGHLKGAALDTFGREPYEGSLNHIDNVILTPHIGSYARAGRVKMEKEAAENLLRELERMNLIERLRTEKGVALIP